MVVKLSAKFQKHDKCIATVGAHGSWGQLKLNYDELFGKYTFAPNLAQE